MKKRYKYLLVIALILVVISATYIFGFSNRNNQSNDSEGFNMISAKAIKGNITVSVSGSSNIEASSIKDVKTIDSETIESIFVEEGDYVEEGDLILTFEDNSTSIDIESYKLDLIQEQNKLEELEEELSNLNIYASQSGYLGEISAEIGDELSSGYLLTTITNKSNVEISGYYYQNQINNISIGDTASVAISGYFAKAEGVVKSIRREPIARDNGTIVYEVIVEVKNEGNISNNFEGLVTIENKDGVFTSVDWAYFEESDPEEVRLETEGNLLKLYVSSGDYVEEGDLLAEIENSSIENDIENQKLTIKKKEMELDELIEELDDIAVYAPISGHITELNVTEGEKVSNNETLLTITDLNNLEVVIPVDELDINKIELNQQAIISAEAVPDITYSAKVSKIALVGNVNNGVATFDVSLLLEETENLKPGMTVNGEIIIESKEDAILVPIEAIQYRQGETYVLMQNTDDSNEPNLVPVEIGLVSEDYVEIVNGLNEGDVVLYQSTAINSQTQSNMNMMVPGVMPPSNDNMRRERSFNGGGMR